MKFTTSRQQSPGECSNYSNSRSPQARKLGLVPQARIKLISQKHSISQTLKPRSSMPDKPKWNKNKENEGSKQNRASVGKAQPLRKRDPSFESGFENVDSDEMDNHHIVVDYQSPFVNGSFINNPSPTELSDDSNDFRFQIPTMITKINRRRSRGRQSKESSETEIQPEQKIELPTAGISRKPHSNFTSRNMLKNDQDLIVEKSTQECLNQKLMHQKVFELAEDEDACLFPHQTISQKKINGELCQKERIISYPSMPDPIKRKVFKKVSEIGSPSLRKPPVGLKSRDQKTFKSDMARHGFLKDLNHLSSFNAFFEQPSPLRSHLSQDLSYQTSRRNGNQSCYIPQSAVKKGSSSLSFYSQSPQDSSPTGPSIPDSLQALNPIPESVSVHKKYSFPFQR